MSNASNRNFGLAQTERERRLAMALDDPGDMTSAQAVSSDPGWQAFFGSLQQKAQDANAAGLNFRADLSGLGRPGVDGMEVMPGAVQSARGQATNVALGQMADQNRARLLAEQAQRDAMRQDAINDAHTSYENQVLASAVPHAPAPVTTQSVDAAGNPDYTMRPSPSETPRQRLASLVPGSAQPALQSQFAAMDEKAAADALAARRQTEVERENRAKDDAAQPFKMLTDATGAPITGPDVLKRVAPPVAATVRAVLDGRQALPTGTALKDPYWKGIVGLAQQADPTFDAIDYNARSKTRQDFTSGASSKQINAINTVVGHLSDLADTGKQLGNTGMDWVNSIYNKLTPGGTTRGVALNNFDTLKEGVANELMRTWRQVGAGSEKEIEDWKAQIGASKSPEELKGAFKTIGGMLESKLSALDSQYKQGMGTDRVSAITPESRQKLDALQGAAGSAPASSGAPSPGRGANPFRKQ